MRDNSDLQRIEKFISNVGKLVKVPVEIYFSGGATAVMFGIREMTIDVDIRFEPDEMQMYKTIQTLKEKLNMNIELASPMDFIPTLPKWKERSIFIAQENKVKFFHCDLYSQIISKVQRGWKQDLSDAKVFLKQAGDSSLLKKLFVEAKPDFIKYPTVNVKKLEKKLLHFIDENKER